MTEDEAKTKWCPFVRHYNALFQPCGNSLAGSMRDHDRSKGMFFNCLGSACMAWRRDGPATIPKDGVVDHGGGRQGIGKVQVPNPCRDGHCGLAGKP